MGDRMTQAVVEQLEQLKAEVAERIVSAVEAFQAGGPDLEGVLDSEAQELPAEIIEDCRVANAGAWGRAKAKQLETPKPFKLRKWGPAPKIESPKLSEQDQLADGIVADKIKFHQSDHAPKQKPPTIEEKNRAIEHLADLRGTDPLAYAEERREWADRLCTTVKAIDDAVSLALKDRTEDGEQSQATKVMAIGLGENVRLWHSPSNDCYASVFVAHEDKEKEVWGEGHWENYSMESTTFHA